MNRRTRQIIPLHIPHLNHTLPKRRARLPIHNLIPHRLQPLRCRPLELTEVVRSSNVNPHIRRFPRRIRKTPHCTRHNFGRTRVVLEIKPLDQIAILLAISHRDVLVLLCVVFIGLDEAYASVSGFEEWAVVAAAGVAVEPVDEAYGHFGEGVGGDFVDVPAEVACGTVVVAADGEAGSCGGGVFGEGSALAEEPDVVGVGGAVFGFGAGSEVLVSGDWSGNRGVRTFRPCPD
jgi:hypothetical protein